MRNEESLAFAIAGALLYDGRGGKPFKADAVVKNGKIECVAPSGELNLTGVAKIDADGLSLAPGFIDVHKHSDETIFLAPDADSSISQGITTEVCGNCGDSDFIVESDAMREAHIAKYGSVRWRDLETFAAEYDRVSPAVNMTMLCGHSSLRKNVMGMAERAPTRLELNRMRELLSTALKQGAAGLSSGLWYVPAKYSQTDELLALSELLRGTNKPYATHMRDEGPRLIEAVVEALKIAENGSGKLEISHLKTMCRENWNKIDELLNLIEDARGAGLAVTADRYPYIHNGCHLRMILPPPYDALADVPGFLKSETEFAKLEKILTKQCTPRDEWNTTIICDIGDKSHPDVFGMTLQEIADKWDIPPARACLKLLKHDCFIHTAFKTMRAENLDKIYARPWVMPGSDGYALPLDYSVMRSHPRSFGTFPLFFKLAGEHAPPEEVIRRMTSLPASVFNLAGRGVIREGADADLILFDEAAFDSNADFANPHVFAAGVSKVFVGGGLAFDGNAPEKRGRFGKFIKIV